MTYEFEKRSRKKRRWGRTYEYSSYQRRIVINEEAFLELAEKIFESLEKSKGLTAQELAEKNDIRVSVAKRILDSLENEGRIRLLVSGQNIKVYGVA